MQQLGCGGCGGYQFRVFATDHNEPGVMRIDCVKCKGFTYIRPPSPHIVIDHSTDSDGHLCDMGPEAELQTWKNKRC